MGSRGDGGAGWAAGGRRCQRHIGTAARRAGREAHIVDRGSATGEGRAGSNAPCGDHHDDAQSRDDERPRSAVGGAPRPFEQVVCIRGRVDGFRLEMKRLAETVFEVHGSITFRSSIKPRWTSDRTVAGRHRRAWAMSSSERSS